jgi:hypothetical protein
VLAIELANLEDFIGQVKKGQADTIFINTAVQEGKTDKDVRLMVAMSRLVAIKDNMLVHNYFLAQKEIAKPEDEAAFMVEAKAAKDKLHEILRNNAPGVIQVEGSVWPVK